MNNTERHAELIEHGWRVDLHGRWHSPNPDDARFTLTLDEAWRTHHNHLDQQPPPAA
jgi:hypothetical protein